LSLLNASAGKGVGKIDGALLSYVEDLRRSGRGKACRFFGIDAELGGKTGEGIAWLRAGMHELGFNGQEEGKKGLSFGRLKKGWEEKREEKRLEKGSHWGADAGRAEEQRVLEMLEKKWGKMNDTVGSIFRAILSDADFVDQHPSHTTYWPTHGNHAIGTRNPHGETFHTTSPGCINPGEYAGTARSRR